MDVSAFGEIDTVHAALYRNRFVLCRGQTQFQILSSIAVHNRRPSTRVIAKTWPSDLVALVKTLWARKPGDRPTISEAKERLVCQIEAMEPLQLEKSPQAASLVDKQSKSRHVSGKVARI